MIRIPALLRVCAGTRLGAWLKRDRAGISRTNCRTEDEEQIQWMIGLN